MSKVITVKYEYGREVPLQYACPEMAFIAGLARQVMKEDIQVCANPKQAILECADLVAKRFKDSKCLADFVIVDSAHVSDISGSNQCGYEYYFIKAFKKSGIEGVDFKWLGSSFNHPTFIAEQISEHGDGNIEYIDGITSQEHPMLYKFIRK